MYDNKFPSKEDYEAQKECFICGEKDGKKLATCWWLNLFGHRVIRDCLRCHDQILILMRGLDPEGKSFGKGLANEHINKLWNQHQEMFRFFIITGNGKARYD